MSYTYTHTSLLASQVLRKLSPLIDETLEPNIYMYLTLIMLLELKNVYFF